MTFIRTAAVINITIAVWLIDMQDVHCQNSEQISGIVAANAASATDNLSDTAAVDPKKLFTKADADKIMGQPTHLADSSSKVKTGIAWYLCSYKADVKDSNTGKIGTIYFLFEQYRQISDAKKKYADIMEANKSHGIENIGDLGDEAYYHTDGTNFSFIMVRKRKNVFTMKVNITTSTTSPNELKMTAYRIAASI
jgi:hypothetical protein